MEHDSLGSTHSGLVGFYALSMMNKSPIYGSDVVHRIFEQTNGTWLLGAGALYPTLNRLVKRGWAKVDFVQGRKKYSITSKGRRSLLAFRSDMNAKAKKYMFAWRLILDLIDHEQLPDFVVERLKVSLKVTESVLTEPRYELTSQEKRYLSTAVRHEIDRFQRRMYNVGLGEAIRQ